jgi:hypothetical protein
VPAEIVSLVFCALARSRAAAAGRCPTHPGTLLDSRCRRPRLADTVSELDSTLGSLVDPRKMAGPRGPETMGRPAYRLVGRVRQFGTPPPTTKRLKREKPSRELREHAFRGDRVARDEIPSAPICEICGDDKTALALVVALNLATYLPFGHWRTALIRRGHAGPASASPGVDSRPLVCPQHPLCLLIFTPYLLSAFGLWRNMILKNRLVSEVFGAAVFFDPTRSLTPLIPNMLPVIPGLNHCRTKRCHFVPSKCT